MNGRAIVIHIDSDTPMFNLDAVLFEQVLVNLLDNTSKYAPADSTVIIEGHRTSDGVIISIADEGPGIPADDVERVFEKFYRLDKGDRQRNGPGFGLAICRGFIEALGGRIRASNRKDRTGAVFTITFPEAILTTQDQEAAE